MVSESNPVKMTNPDALVDDNGIDVELRRVTDAVFDGNKVLDEQASTIETVTVQAIISQPSDQLQQRPEGRVETTRLQATVKSDVDVLASREGERDEITPQSGPYNGKTFAVVDVADDTHPFVDETKKTLTLEQRDG